MLAGVSKALDVGTVVQTFNSSTKETSRSLLRLGWSTDQNLGQPGLHGDTLPQKKNKFKEI